MLPESQWRGYRPPHEPPAPAPARWGEPAPMPDAVTLARLEADMMGKVMGPLATDPKDRLARALASLGRGLHGARLVSFTGLHEMQRNLPMVQIQRHAID